ncbi:MAG: hypothetical protein Q9179_001361 [Wetmoreana sp. 5 TL-2023]
MAKRSADTERIGQEAGFSGGGSSDEPQVQRATAAQMAARNLFAKKLLRKTVPNKMRSRIAKPRGGRRPGALARPVSSQASPLSQSFPAPSWGTTNPAASSNPQQPSGGFTFGQQPGPFSQSSHPTHANNNQTSSQSLSFPPFGGQNNAQQPTAPASTGFNFAAPPVNNPFASQTQGSAPQSASKGFSGSIFNLPPSTSAQSQTPTYQGSVWDLKTPSHWMKEKDLPEDYKDKDPQSLFVAHAPFKWGQPDPPKPDSTQQPLTGPNPDNASQQKPPSSTNISGQNEQPKQTSSSIFQNLQEQNPSSSNPFGQQPPQQPQTSNIFGHLFASSFQSQPNQTISNVFEQTNTSNTQGVSSIVGKPATSPTKNGDAMSTTPDTSPQAIKDSDRLGPFSSVNAASTPTLTNGNIQGGSGSNLFGIASNTSNNQSVNSMLNGAAANETSADGSSGGSEDTASDISLGSPKKNQGASSIKNRKIAQPSFGRPHIEEKANPKTTFGGFSWSPTAAPNAPPPSTSPPKQSVVSSEASGHTSSSISAKPTTQDSSASGLGAHRQPGTPPPPPDDFTEEQKRQLITGYRLKQLDRGLRSYLEYSSWSKDEIESISTFYELRKQAILDADGGPVKEIVSNKRAAEADETQNKKARRQAPSTTAEEASPFSGMSSAGKYNPTKRKADEDLIKDTDQISVNGMKRSKPEEQITYPSLPESSGSQTAKLFGNLVGKKSQESSTSTGEFAVNGYSSNGVASNEVTQPSKPDQPQSSLFFQSAKPSGAFDPNSAVETESQSALFNFSNKLASNQSPLKSGNDNASGRTHQPQTNSPFKTFFQPQSSSGYNATSASSNSLSVPSSVGGVQSSNAPPLFSNLNGGSTANTNFKRKASEYESNEHAENVSSPTESDEQQSKKPRTSEELTSAPQTTAERPGFGESIFSHPATKPSNTTNIFSHLSNSASENDDDDEADDGGEENGNEKKQANASSLFPKTNTPSSTVYNPFASASFKPTEKSAANEKPASSSVFNPFASATVPPAQESANEEKPAGRSLFDRIEKDDNGQPVKPAKPIDFGQSILKTPKAGSIFSQNNDLTTNNIFGNLGPKSTDAAPSATPASSLFGKTAGSSTAPVANMSSSTGTGDSPGGDNTWKAGTPVKFAPTTGAPSFNITSPSPTKNPLTGLFGAPKANTTSETPGSPAKPAPLTFGISAPLKDSNSSLAPPSETQSESSSRATSPGASAGEGGNDASDAVHEEETHPELDTAEANKAEADEDVLFDAMSKVYELAPYKTRNAETGQEETGRKWVVRGHEQFRVLKHRETKKARMLMKLKVNGRVILNAGLQKSLSYVLAAPKKVRVPVPSNGKIDTWMVQLEKEVDGEKLVGLLEENKAN